MSFRRWVATGAFAAAAAMCSVLPAHAQGGGGGGGGFGGGAPPFTPAPGAKDLKSVLYNWAWHVGMLRGQAENELIGTLDWHGEGTIQVDGQPCTTTKLRVQINYQTPGYRTQIECRRANGQTYSNVETMSGVPRADNAAELNVVGVIQKRQVDGPVLHEHRAAPAILVGRGNRRRSEVEHQIDLGGGGG